MAQSVEQDANEKLVKDLVLQCPSSRHLIEHSTKPTGSTHQKLVGQQNAICVQAQQLLCPDLTKKWHQTQNNIPQPPGSCCQGQAEAGQRVPRLQRIVAAPAQEEAWKPRVHRNGSPSALNCCQGTSNVSYPHISCFRGY